MIKIANIRQIDNFSNYYVDDEGNVYKKDMTKIKPFNSNGYFQVYMRDDENKRHVFGVHQVVAMAFLPDYFEGCVVHHKDEDKHNNKVENLQIEYRSNHSRHHADPTVLTKYIKEHGSYNKGMKMSEEFREKCRQSALKRVERKRAENQTGFAFHGNQFVDKYGNKKDYKNIEKFKESCRQGKLKQNKNDMNVS